MKKRNILLLSATIKTAHRDPETKDGCKLNIIKFFNDINGFDDLVGLLKTLYLTIKEKNKRLLTVFC